jgi:ferrochelatase
MSPIGVLLMAYGGPDSLDEVEPYLLDVRGGRPTPAAIVEELRERYRRIGGRSPILERTREQAEALERALNATASGAPDPAFRVFVGMRHWRPYIADTLAGMAREGIERAVGLAMAPHYSRLSIGAYFKKVEEARSSIEVAPIERWHLLPAYVEALADRVEAALAKFPAGERERVPVIFTAHSLPQRIQEWHDPYPRELGETAAALARRLGLLLSEPPATSPPAPAASGRRCYFAYQSAAMTPDPWLGPDAGGVIERLVAGGARHLLLAPLGFVCDHIEILYDVDIVFREQASRLGARLERIEMLNASPRLMTGLAGLVREQAAGRGWV